MKKFTIMLSALLAFGSLQSFAQQPQGDLKPSTKSEFNETGYYRLKNVKTGRYLKVYGNVFNTTFTQQVLIFNTGASISMVPNYGDVVADPGTVLYVQKLGEKELSEKDVAGNPIKQFDIEVKCQGTGLVENLNYSEMNESLKKFGIDGTDPQVSIRKTGKKVNGRETYYVETFQNFGPLAFNALKNAAAAAQAAGPGSAAAETYARLKEFAQKVTGHDPDPIALSKVTGLKFIDLNQNSVNGDFTISYEYRNPANHIIYIGDDGERKDADGEWAQWYIEPIEDVENVFGVNVGIKDTPSLDDKSYTTLFVSFPFTVDGDATKAYYGKTLNGNTLKMEAITEVPAFTPVLIEFTTLDAHKSLCTPTTEVFAPITDNKLRGIIHLNNTVSNTFGFVSIPDKEKEWTLTGADGAEYKAESGKYDAATQYVFGPANDESNKLGFYKYTQTHLSSNKAYLKVDGSAPIKGGIRIDLGDKELTAINGVITESAPKAIYDLSGRRVENPTTGLYIVNGKKVLVK